MKTVRALSCASVLVSTSLLAQLAPSRTPGETTPAAPVKVETVRPSRSDQEEPLVLNVFEVNAKDEDEYRAANTTTGTRYNTPVKDLPMNIEVITPAFIRDIGALDMRDVLEYVSGIQLDNQTNVNSSKDNPENSTLIVRGISAALKKDGFARFIPVDPITVSRVDIIKGPGGALYGQNGTGGVVNYSSVLAGNTPTGRFGLTVGSFGLRRAEFLWSAPLDKKGRFGLALPIAYSSNKNEAMYYEIQNFVFNPALTWKISPSSSLLVSWESRFNERDAVRGFFLTDNALDPSGQPYGVLIPGRPGTNRVLRTPNQRSFRFEGPDTYRRERDYVPTIRFDHAFSRNLQWWVGYSHEDIYVKDRTYNISLRNANDSSIPLKIRSDPRYLAMLRPGFGTAQPQILDIRPNNLTLGARTLRPTYKSELYYAFDIASVQNRLIAGISYGPLESGNMSPNDNYFYGNTGQSTNPATIAWEALSNDVIITRFRSPTDFASVRRWDNASYGLYPHGPQAVLGTTASYVKSLFWDRNLYLNLQSTFFNGKFQTILGFFDTRNNRAGNVYDVNGTYLWNSAPPAGTPAGTPAGIRRPQPVRNTSPSATAIWLPNEWLRVYANAMSALDPGPSYSGYDGDGKPLDAAVITNAETGVRFELLKKKLLISAAYFQMKDEHRPVSYAAAIQNLLFAAGSGATLSSGFGAFVRTDTETKGLDLKIDYLPLPNLRINLGLSSNDVNVVGIDPFVTPANPDATRLAAQQRFVNAGGASSVYLGKPPSDISRYTGSGFVRYELKQGPIKGLWTMLGAKYLGGRTAELVTVNTTTGDVSVATQQVKSHYLFDLNFGYRRKIVGHPTNFQLNISNLEDDQTFYGATWQTGRTYRLSANVSF